MFRMKNKLNNLYNANREVKFALVGAGKMGKGLVNQLSRIKGLTSSVVIDEKPETAKLINILLPPFYLLYHLIILISKILVYL